MKLCRNIASILIRQKHHCLSHINLANLATDSVPTGTIVLSSIEIEEKKLELIRAKRFYQTSTPGQSGYFKFKSKLKQSSTSKKDKADSRSRFPTSSNWRSQFRHPVRMEEWITPLSDMQAHVWSISGLETTVVLRRDGLGFIGFDMGLCTRESVKCQHVFISHGHVDHSGAIVNHMSKREIFGVSPSPTYYVPPHLVKPLKEVSAGFQNTHGPSLKRLDIQPIGIGDTVNLPGSHYIQPFPTIHSVPSQGYILYHKQKKLKPEFVGLESKAIAAKHREGVPIHDVTDIPQMAFTGDTTSDVFTNLPPPDLLNVRLLITEATYIDDECGIEMARERGHTHLYELIQNEHLFTKVEAIILMHFSDRYSVDYIKKTVAEKLPESLKSKVFVATLGKEKN